MSHSKINELRDQLDQVNLELLEKINYRAKLVQKIGQIKQEQSMKRFDPVRERDMINKIIAHNQGPFVTSTIEHIFKEIFKAGLELLEDEHQKALLVSRKKKPEDTIIQINDIELGNG